MGWEQPWAERGKVKMGQALALQKVLVLLEVRKMLRIQELLAQYPQAPKAQWVLNRWVECLR